MIHMDISGLTIQVIIPVLSIRINENLHSGL